MELLDVLATVAALISAFRDGFALFAQWRRMRKEKKEVDRLQRSQKTIQTRYKPTIMGRRSLGKFFANSDGECTHSSPHSLFINFFKTTSTSTVNRKVYQCNKCASTIPTTETQLSCLGNNNIVTLTLSPRFFVKSHISAKRQGIGARYWCISCNVCFRTGPSF